MHRSRGSISTVFLSTYFGDVLTKAVEPESSKLNMFSSHFFINTQSVAENMTET